MSAIPKEVITELIREQHFSNTTEAIVAGYPEERLVHQYSPIISEKLKKTY